MGTSYSCETGTGHKRKIFHNYNNPQEVVVPPKLDTFKIQLNGVLSHLAVTVLFPRKVGQDDPCPFQPGIL